MRNESFIGIPTKKIRILVVTITGKGNNPRDMIITISFESRTVSFFSSHSKV